MTSNIPTKIGKYDVIDLIGRGGMGVVYKAKDPHLERPVAIKMMTSGFADNPDLLKRFFREAQSLGSLQHPNIVTVYDLGDYGGNPYLVMEFLEGEGLDSVLTSRRQLSLLEKTSIIVQVCNGLAYAHRRGVVHRDIKPANIMLSQDGGVKIFDFGIAHIGDNSVTKTGQIVGTLSYMSPEQVNGKPVDTRTDLFSTGVVLYQLFTNHLPFEGESTATTLLKIIYDPPPPLKNFLTSYPPELEGILLRALAKDREERYHSADEFALDLSQLQAHLKQELIAQDMQEIGVFLEKSDLYKAREYLVQVLKVDAQHVQATQLLREVQHRIKKEEVSEQVRKLRQGAEEAVAREQFDTAEECLEQALALDKNNSDLHRLRDSVRAAALRLQKLHNALKLAESAHQDGDLDTAKQAVEEALQIAPDDTQAKALYRLIQRDWVERSRQRQLENYLFQARQDISSRKFTAALEILKLAEALDPGAPQVHALMESASAGRDQERRRKDLEAITRDIEDALNRDDYRSACLRADEGLARFPDERTLLKLRALAERQRQIEERKQFIDEQLALARKLLQESRNQELLSALEAALAKTGPEPRLQSLLTIVTENVQRERLERRKAEYLQKAKEFLRNKEYDSAIQTLEGAGTELRNEPEIEDLLQFVREEVAADQHRRTSEAAAERAHAFVAEQQYEDAIRLLETTLREVPDEELRIVLAETRRAAVDYREKLQATLGGAEKLLQARKANEALKLLESQPAAYFRDPSLAKLLETARSETERLGRVHEAIERSRRLLEEEDTSGGRRVLEECRQSEGTTPELEAQLAAIEVKRVSAASRALEKAIGDARILLKASEYQAALDKLQAVSEIARDVPTALRSEYGSVQQQCSAGLVQARKTQIERFMVAGDLTRAAELLRQSLVQFPGDRELSNLGNVLDQETARRSEARERLAEAQRAFARAKWKEGGELLRKAFAASTRAPAVREQVLDAFVQAGVSAVEADWRAAEMLLEQLAELKSDYAPPSVLRSRIRERKREEFIAQCVAQAKRLLSSGDLPGSAREVNAGLASYPGDASLKELQNVILERTRQQEERVRDEQARQEKETYLREVNGRVEREPALDRRITILDEALVRYPAEQRLQQQAEATRELWKRVSAIATQALSLEAGRKYVEALDQWTALRTLHRQQPDLENNIARVTRLHEQARAKARTTWLEKVNRELASSNFDRTRALLSEARQQFPGDRDLSQLEEQLADGIKRRAKAQKLIAESGRSFERSRWEKGLETLNRGLEVAGQDAVVREQALIQLAKASEAALKSNVDQAQTLAERLSVLEPTSPLVPALRGKIEDRKREQTIVERLTTARRVQQAGDLAGALRELSLGNAAYPDDQRFIQAKKEVEQQLQQLEEQRAREREKAHQLELERERERERKLQEERERVRLHEQQEARKRQEALERERIQTQEAERKRQQELERERAQEEERKRQETERKRQEELEQERVRAAQEREQQRERERRQQEALEQERLKVEAVERERERALARQRELELERERQAAEQRRLEEAQRIRDEALRKEEQLQREREAARQLEQERKRQEKARKREERERKQAAAAEKRRSEKEAVRLREEERRREALKLQQEAAETGSARAESRGEVEETSATTLFGPVAAPESASEAPAGRDLQPPQEKEAATHRAFSFAALEPARRRAILAGSAVVLLLAVVIVRKVLEPHTITIQVVTTPDGAAVTLSPLNKTRPSQECVTPHCNLDVAPGTYTLQIRHEGFEASEQTVEVSARGQRNFPVTLVAVAPTPPPSSTPPTPPEPARLEARGLSPGAELFVGGKSMGKVGRKGEISATVPPGDYEIKIVAKNQNPVVLSRHLDAGRVVSLGRDDVYPKPPSPPGSQPAPENLEWQRAQSSQTIDSMEQFLEKYPNGPHSSEARAMLENLYWSKDSRANTADAYREYLRVLPHGLHAASAEEEIGFLEAKDHRDPAALEAFISKYPHSQHIGEANDLLENTAWERTNKGDEKSLDAYLTKFPKGRHADDARKQVAQMQASSRPAAKNPEIMPPSPSVDERRAVLAVLARYKKAYEDRNIVELESIWPGMPRISVGKVQDFFKTARDIHLDYGPSPEPEIRGDQAIVRFSQSLTYDQDKKLVKRPPSRLTMYLKRQNPETWVIESIR
jgi:serine/threonine protein kinase